MGAPTGTVTFLFTDIEGSTQLWEAAPEAMRMALALHDDIVRKAITARGGYVFSTGGDGFAAAFPRAGDAVAAAGDAQVPLGAPSWPAGVALRLRMGLHTGEADERDGSYFGPPVNRAARLMAAAHGGQIVLSEVTAGLVRHVPRLDLIDLGTYRLRGMIAPSRVFGVEAKGLDWVDRPLVTPESSRGNLPRPATEWFGPLADLQQRVADLAHHRLVTLTGPGGIGKTRLAVEAAGLAGDGFSAGVWMVELAAVGDAEGVHGAVAAALGVIPQDGQSVRDSIVGWLEERRLLLVLDNCEHVLGPISELVGYLNERVPDVTVLATSREPLGLPAERVVPVPSMSPTDAADLFCDRALARDASLVFDSSALDTVNEICGRLDGIPLAIELAAARARSLSPTDLLVRLNDRFQLLRHGGRGGIERHQTLRATVAWSYNLLSVPEQLLFCRLSVITGGFDLAAAEAVGATSPIQESDVLDLVSALVEKSLVVVDRGPSGVRYRLLETLRQFGEEELERRGETQAARARYLAHGLTIAARIGELWASPAQRRSDRRIPG